LQKPCKTEKLYLNNDLEKGQAIDVMVLGDSIEKGLLILSLKRANQIKNLSNLAKYNESEEIIDVKPTELENHLKLELLMLMKLVRKLSFLKKLQSKLIEQKLLKNLKKVIQLLELFLVFFHMVYSLLLMDLKV